MTSDSFHISQNFIYFFVYLFICLGFFFCVFFFFLGGGGGGGAGGRLRLMDFWNMRNCSLQRLSTIKVL